MSTFNDMPEYLANKLDKKIELTTIGLEDMSSSVHTNSNADIVKVAGQTLADTRHLSGRSA